MCNIVFRMPHSFVLSYNMQCIWAQDHDMGLCFILVSIREPYVGVTDKGKAFLQDTYHPYPTIQLTYYNDHNAIIFHVIV